MEYLLARRWETRLMITWIVLTFLTAGTSLMSPVLSLSCALTTLAVGLLLHVVTSTFITPSYNGLSGASRMIMGLPPVMISALYFGMLDRWMKRMGFGRTFRTWVPAAAFCCLVGPMIPAPAAVPLVIGAVSSSFWRVRSDSPLALMPASLAIIIAIIMKFMVVPA